LRDDLLVLVPSVKCMPPGNAGLRRALVVCCAVVHRMLLSMLAKRLARAASVVSPVAEILPRLVLMGGAAVLSAWCPFSCLVAPGHPLT